MTRADFERLIAPLPQDDAIVAEFRDDTGHFVPLDQKKFYNMTGAHFTTSYRATAKAFSNWQRLFSGPTIKLPSPPSGLPNQATIESFEKSPPALYLKNEPTIGGLGLYSKGFIKKGAIICLYTGDIVYPDQPKSLRSKLYSLGAVDSAVNTGLASYINDGPPNCWFINLTNYKGIPLAPAVVATRDIAPDEPLLEMYGIGHALFEAAYHIDQERYHKVQKFCLSGKFQDLKATSDEERALHWYVVSTPTVFLRLLLDRSLKESSVKPFLAKLDPRVTALLKDLIQIANLLLKDATLCETFINLFLGKVRITSIQNLLSMLKSEKELTAEKLKEYLLLAQALDQTHLLIHGSLIGSYLETTDEPPPFNDADIKEIFLKISKQFQAVYIQHLFSMITTCQKNGWDKAPEKITQLLLELGLNLVSGS